MIGRIFLTKHLTDRLEMGETYLLQNKLLGLELAHNGGLGNGGLQARYRCSAPNFTGI